MPEGVFQWENSTAPKGFRKEVVSIGAAKYVSLAALAMIAPVEDVALCHHLHTTERRNRVSSSWLCVILGMEWAKRRFSTIEFENGRWPPWTSTYVLVLERCITALLLQFPNGAFFLFLI